MRKRLLPALLALCMLLALLPTAFAAAPAGGEFSISIDGIRTYTYAYEVAEQVNRLRDGLGLGRLVIDPALMETAMNRAAECAVYYSHTRPNGTRCFTAFPSRGGTSAENIAAGYLTPASVMSGWTNSSGHYANMTNTSVNAIGVGCFYANGTYYWAQCFTGGAYSSGSTVPDDEMGTATFPVVKEYFSPVGGSGTISLRVGESCQLPVYNRNLGFSNYTATVSGVYGAALSAGTNLVKLSGDSLVITAVAEGSGTVTLSLPSGDSLSFTVQVTKRFTDVPGWCADAANWAAAEGIAQGYGNGRFGATDFCTNAQILTFLYRAAGEQTNLSQSPFTVESYYQDAVDWAYEQGIIDRSFVPGAYCTRASAVNYIWKAFGSPVAGGGGFADVSPDTDDAGAVAWAVEKGITDGYPGSIFRPDKTCSRGEIITFLYRAYVQPLSA